MTRWATAISVLVTGAAIVAVVYITDVELVIRTFSAIDAPTLATASALVAASLVLAYFRFRLTLRVLGAGAVDRWSAVIAFSVGNLASQVLVNMIGQSFTRAAVLQAAGVPVGITLMATYLERIIAFATLALLGTVAAFILFGTIRLDMAGGGGYFLQLIIGGPIVVITALSWAATRLLTKSDFIAGFRIGVRLIPTVFLGMAVHLMTFGAFLVLILRSGVPVDIRLATSIILIMFVSSLPISLSGWGLREFSAAYVFSLIGIPAEAAVVMAATVGGLFLVMALVLSSVVAVVAWFRPPVRQSMPAQPGSPQLSDTIVVWPIALLTGCLVFFQLHVTMGSGRLTVNAADTIAITAFILTGYFVWTRGLQDWLPRRILWCQLAIAVLFAFGSLNAWLSFGGTQWTLVNRLFGFPVLLGYCCAPLLVVAIAGERGRTVLGGVFVVTALTILVLQVAASEAERLFQVFPHAFLYPQPEGFAQNRNAFAFQLLMAFAVLVSLGSRPTGFSAPWWTLGVAVLAAGTVYLGSRIGTALILLGVLLALIFPYVDFARWRAHPFWVSAVAAGTIAAALAIPKSAPLIAWLFPGAHSDEVRWELVEGGIELWREHPVLGAGLGAFVAARLNAGLPFEVIHSVPIWFLAETGLIGILVYFLYVTTLLWTAVGLAATPDTRQRGYGMLIALAAFLLGGLVFDVFFQRTFWFVIGLLLATGGVRLDVAAHNQSQALRTGSGNGGAAAPGPPRTVP